MDIEEVLVALWTAKIEYPMSAGSRIRAEDSSKAEIAVGILGSRQKRIAYWLVRLQCDRDELAHELLGLGFKLHPKAIVLPKGALKRLRAKHDKVPPSSVRATATADLKVPSLFEWRAPGTPRSCDHLTVDEIRQIHEALTADFAGTSDPIYPPGVKSEPLLESATSRPQASFGDFTKYPSVESAGAALLHSLVQNHPFFNGNKRTALVAMLVFLDKHNLVINSNQDETFKFMIRVAAHDLLPGGYKYDSLADREVFEIAQWILKNSRAIRRQERIVTWRELQRILRNFECKIDQSRGEKLMIARTIRTRRRFGIGEKRQELESFYINTSDGREVPRSVLKRIRHELFLDADHGVDAEAFYGDAKDVDFFLLEYSQLLKRLARV